jgi:hypothetical protein
VAVASVVPRMLQDSKLGGLFPLFCVGALLSKQGIAAKFVQVNTMTVFKEQASQAQGDSQIFLG